MDVVSWIRRLFSSWFAAPFSARQVDDLPDELEPRFVYLIGDADYPWSAALICPCGCRAVVQLSLIKQDSPRWRHRVHQDGTVTLDPSVWRTKGCHSHFIIRHGRLIWARGRRMNASIPRSSLG